MKKIGLLFIVVILFSCNNEQNQDKSNSPESSSKDSEELAEHPITRKTTYHLNMPELIGNKKEVYLSDLVKSINYVPLETTQKYMIGEKSVRVKPCAELIFIGEHGKPIGVFDLEGNFLYTIGTIGKGPGEYNFDYAFWPEEGSRIIYLANTNVKGISSYSFDGEFLGDIHTDPYSITFVPLGDDKFLSWHFMQQNHEENLFRLFFHDLEGSIYHRIFEPKKEYNFSRSISINSPHFTYTPNGVLYNSWEENKIMRANQDGRFEEAITWELGKYEMPFDPSDDFDRFRREKHKYIYDINAWESVEHFYLKFHHKNRLHLAAVKKASEDFFIVANPDTAQDGVYNDIDGGPSFWPFWYSDGGKRFFKLLQSIDLINEESYPNREIEIKDSEAEARYKEIIASLDEYSNPVLMIVEMK